MRPNGRCRWFVACCLLVTLGVAAPRPAHAGNIISAVDGQRYADVIVGIESGLVGLGMATAALGCYMTYVWKEPSRFWSISNFVLGALNLASGVFFLADNGDLVRTIFAGIALGVGTADIVVGGLITYQISKLGRVTVAPLVGRTPDGHAVVGAALRLLDF